MRNVKLGQPKANWFDTLNEALASEDLVNLWPVGKIMCYGDTVGFAAAGRWISVYRSESGRYERPVHYATQMADTYPREEAA